MRSDRPALAIANEETILHEQVPIFAHLVAVWARCGRTVPGRADDEWHELLQPPRFFPPAPAAPGEPE
ncbi:hypothetical protein RMN57_08495 [Kitasatospora sp. CM 4170]|uniref:Uncharacterized protein n=1 Tax=Kitasatospora aburaviensis TaxID=67265 RepID=A0ABW1FAI5_9ACTN|nr:MULTISPECIES: hypothetical protein [unclassified Kitasatospora]MCG6495278.1 hypothetical protein [Kitasatospora sp. A2-31]WNM44752.1 hypothetical protein RMN57_08495 [Kitasatospora sp. CM 4170]